MTAFRVFMFHVVANLRLQAFYFCTYIIQYAFFRGISKRFSPHIKIMTQLLSQLNVNVLLFSWPQIYRYNTAKCMKITEQMAVSFCLTMVSSPHSASLTFTGWGWGGVEKKTLILHLKCSYKVIRQIVARETSYKTYLSCTLVN